MTIPANLPSLPDDILLPIFAQLPLTSLLCLRLVNHSLQYQIDQLGIPQYHSFHKINHTTLHPSSSSSSSKWSSIDIVKYNHYINTSLSKHRWHSIQIGHTWNTSVIPTLHLSPTRLVLGVGGKILSHPLLPPPSSSSCSGEEEGGHGHGGRGKVIGKAREYPLNRTCTTGVGIGSGSGNGTRSDIVGIIELPDFEQSLIVAQFDGTIQRLVLPDNGASIPKFTAKYLRPKLSSSGGGGGGIGGMNAIHTFTSNEDSSLVLSTHQGYVSLHQTKSPWLEPSIIPLSTSTSTSTSTSNSTGTSSSSSSRAWSCLLRTQNRSEALLGISGSIAIHPLRPTGLDTKPSGFIHGPELPLSSSSYDMCFPSSSESNHNPNLLLSAWYDSHLRLHDLRQPTLSCSASFSDPYTWADSTAFYTCAFVGSNHIAGGCSRHGTVSIFDLRFTNTNTKCLNSNTTTSAGGNSGWSCFSPGGKGSPVYKLIGDGGRLWGVTERRSFVLTFDGRGDILQSPSPPPSLDTNTNTSQPSRGRGRGRQIPNGYKGRGGKWQWTTKYDDYNESTTGVGYLHNHQGGGVQLFDSLKI